MRTAEDPGPEIADKILADLEGLVLTPTETARQARRLRAHISALRLRIRRCIETHGEDGLYDPELVRVGGQAIDALKTSIMPPQDFDPDV